MTVSKSWASTSGAEHKHAQELSAERPQIDLQRHQQAPRLVCKPFQLVSVRRDVAGKECHKLVGQEDARDGRH